MELEETIKLKYDLKVAIVILNYNGLHHLKRFLPSIIQHKPDYADIIIADNASTDQSLEYLHSSHPGIQILELDQNTGYAGGYNNALDQVSAEYYFLLNSDVEINHTSINALINFLDNHPAYAACQPKVKSYLQRDEFEYAGASGGWIDFFGYPLCRGRILATNEKDVGQYDDMQRIFWATGAALMIRSEVFHKVGGFDSDFFAHMEEIDLCWRIQRIGMHIGVVPESEIYHLGGGTLSYESPRKTFLNFRNSLYILAKNQRGHIVIWMLFIRLVLDGIAGIRFLCLADWRNFMAIIKAHLHFYVNLPDTWKKRKAFLHRMEEQGIKERVALDGKYSGCIVWDYFILRKKKFSQLGINEQREKEI